MCLQSYFVKRNGAEPGNEEMRVILRTSQSLSFHLLPRQRAKKQHLCLCLVSSVLSDFACGSDVTNEQVMEAEDKKLKAQKHGLLLNIEYLE